MSFTLYKGAKVISGIGLLLTFLGALIPVLLGVAARWALLTFAHAPAWLGWIAVVIGVLVALGSLIPAIIGAIIATQAGKIADAAIDSTQDGQILELEHHSPGKIIDSDLKLKVEK